MAKKDSEYTGFPGDTPKDRAAFASRMFGRDFENMKTDYETYKRPGDPTAKAMQDSLRVGNEASASKMKAAHNEADNELMREKKRYRAAADDRKREAAKSKSKPTPEDQMPIEARELMRQKAKDAAYKESEKERSLGNMFARGGAVKSSASKRADGIAQRGKTRA